MSSESLSVIRDIVAIILMATGAVLCIVLAVTVGKLLPSLGRSTQNIERATEDAANAGTSIIVASENVKGTTEHLLEAAKGVSEATPVLQRALLNIEKLTESAAEAGPNIAARRKMLKEPRTYLK